MSFLNFLKSARKFYFLDFYISLIIKIIYIIVLFLYITCRNNLLPLQATAAFCFYTLLVGMMIPLYLYKGINLSIIASIFESNLSESIEYISTISYYQFISIFVYFSFGFFILYSLVLYSKLGNKNNEFKIILLLLLFLLLVTFYKPVKEYVKGSGFSVLNIRVYPIQLVSNIYYLTFSYFNQKEMLEYGINIEPDWKIQSVNSKYDNYVLVIGESMRADYMSLYGYPIETTPFLKRTRGIVFTNYISSAPNTQPSLLHSFYDKNNYEIKPNNNIINLANSAGFDTYWISNQGVLGNHDTVASRIGFLAKHHIFTKKGGYDDSETRDLKLLEYFDEYLLEIDNSKKNLFVFHLMGSHPSFCMRLNSLPEIYFINQDMTCYLETFKQTDLFLERLIARLEKLGSYSVIYFSDHGLQHYNTRKDKLSLHVGNEYQESFSVPLVKISSDDLKQIKIDARRSGMFFLNAFSEWLGIDEESLKLPYLFFSNDVDKKPTIVFDWENYIIFDSLPKDSAKK